MLVRWANQCRVDRLEEFQRELLKLTSHECCCSLLRWCRHHPRLKCVVKYDTEVFRLHDLDEQNVMLPCFGNRKVGKGESQNGGVAYLWLSELCRFFLLIPLSSMGLARLSLHQWLYLTYWYHLQNYCQKSCISMCRLLIIKKNMSEPIAYPCWTPYGVRDPIGRVVLMWTSNFLTDRHF